MSCVRLVTAALANRFGAAFALYAIALAAVFFFG